MRRWVIPVAVVCVLLTAVTEAARPWWIEVEWGGSFPGSTVYSVTLDSDGKLRAERRGMPPAPPADYERTVPGESAARIRATGEKFIRQLDFDRTQGGYKADGGFASVYVHDGSATLGAHLSLLMSREEAGKEWNDFLSMVTALLPNDFVR